MQGMDLLLNYFSVCSIAIHPAPGVILLGVFLTGLAAFCTSIEHGTL